MQAFVPWESKDMCRVSYIFVVKFMAQYLTCEISCNNNGENGGDGSNSFSVKVGPITVIRIKIRTRKPHILSLLLAAFEQFEQVCTLHVGFLKYWNFFFTIL